MLGLITIIVLFVFVFGAIIGSFLNVLILRLPAEEKITGRSHCANCGHELAAKDLIPVLSFIFLAGKCRYCKKAISRRYFYIEVITGLLFCLAFLASGLQYQLISILDGSTVAITAISVIQLLRSWFIISVLIVIFMVDYEHFLILDNVLVYATIKLLFINLILDYLNHATWLNSSVALGLIAGLGLFIFFGTLYYFSAGRWIGFGDVKLTWFLGLAALFPGILLSTFLAFMLGAVVGIILLSLKKKGLKSEVPFGTFLAISCIITVLYGQPVIDGYLNLIGWR